MIEFQAFRKIPRFSREMVITEKIDGTNGQILIEPYHMWTGPMVPIGSEKFLALANEEKLVSVSVGSRKRWLTKESDHYGFYLWVMENASDIVRLGVGRHFGEWWGEKINRGYGLKEHRFSLFNAQRWCEYGKEPTLFTLGDGTQKLQQIAPKCCHVVPVLHKGPFDSAAVEEIIEKLRREGSLAAPGFMRPEGIVIYHVAGNVLFKKTLEHDERPKGASRGEA